VGIFDNVEIRGRAKVSSLGDLLVHQGDIHSGDITTFEIEEEASLSIGWLDLPNSCLACISGDITFEQLTCQDCQ